MNKYINDLYELCSISSISGNEQEILHFLCQYLKKRNFYIEKIIVDKERYNIFAYSKHSVKYTAIFCTHVDTVAPYITPKIDEENQIIWGRGSCDAKGILVAMIEALVKQRDNGFDDLALLLTVGEEELSDGAKIANNILANRAHYLIIGEPTNLKAAYAQKGAIVFDLEATGINAHSSMPNLGKSALHILVNDTHKLINYPWPKNEQYQETFLNVGVFNAGEARNVIAKKANIKCIMRTCIEADKLINIIKSIISEDVRLSVLSKTDPFLYFCPEGFNKFLASFGSDAPYLSLIGKPILLGPGSLEVAHREDEHITFNELANGINAYEKLSINLRNRDNHGI